GNRPQHRDVSESIFREIRRLPQGVAALDAVRADEHGEPADLFEWRGAFGRERDGQTVESAGRTPAVLARLPVCRAEHLRSPFPLLEPGARLQTQAAESQQVPGLAWRDQTPHEPLWHYP